MGLFEDKLQWKYAIAQQEANQGGEAKLITANSAAKTADAQAEHLGMRNDSLRRSTAMFDRLGSSASASAPAQSKGFVRNGNSYSAPTTPITVNALTSTGSVLDSPLLRESSFEQLSKPLGLKRGKTRVTDKTGRGSPVKDTVDAKLADGEAVLNAGAAEILGRDKIEQLNEQGAQALGLRGGSKMVGDTLHAYGGVTPEEIAAGIATAKRRAGYYTPKSAPASTPPSLGNAGKALGPLANVAMYAAAPEEEKGDAASGFGVPGLVVGLAHKAVQPVRDRVYSAIDEATGLSAKVNPLVEKVQTAFGGQRQSPVAKPALTETPQAGNTFANVDLSKVSDPAMMDKIERSQQFRAMGLSGKDRANAPAYEQGGYSGKGLARLNVDSPSDEIYRKGNSYMGVGAKPKAPTEQDQKAGLRQALTLAALGGSNEAAAILGQMTHSEEGAANRQNNLDVAAIQAGAKGKSGKGDSTTLTDQLKLGTTLIGEGREAELLQAVNQRKQSAVADALKSGDTKRAKAIQDADLDQDFIMETANLMKQREAADANSSGKRAAIGGGVGAALGGVAGLGAGLMLKKPKLAMSGAGALMSAIGGGLYGYRTGSKGIDQYTDLNRIAALESDGSDLLGDGLLIPGDVLPDDQKVLRGLRR